MVLQQRMAAALFLTGLLCLVINSGYSYGPSVLALMGLLALCLISQGPLALRLFSSQAFPVAITHARQNSLLIIVG